jgi:hypothetical protein
MGALERLRRDPSAIEGVQRHVDVMLSPFERKSQVAREERIDA